ncbi:MAG TPA: pyruvate carboxylase [Solimonas sp.]|nr:pyruvate carboxylase [Solimonas sp.]
MERAPIRKLLVANRGEISIRVMRACAELGIRTVAIYAHEDRFALHRFKADESYCVGRGRKPIAAYLDIPDIIRVAKAAGVDAIHPGYGFLSENPDFAEACAAAGIRFVGPSPRVLRTLGDKVAARAAADAAKVPTLPATGELPRDLEACKPLVAAVGYPVMMKASWGGGGRGMRVIESEAELGPQMESARREAAAAFGNDAVYVEKLVRRARHVEVQVLGDTHGNLVHLFERDCTVQRRNQKVVERAPAPYLQPAQREALCAAAVRLCASVGYSHAGTVEFLMDAETGAFYFIEVNPRIQVEHTVTEMVTGVDLVAAQIRVSEGATIGDPGLPRQADLRLSGHALQCRVTTEDPENGFTPDHGRVTAYRSPAGFGIRLDGGTVYANAMVTPHYDSLLVKVTAWGPEPEVAIRRMDRALREFRIRGVSTNLQFLENVIAHPLFVKGEATTRFIDTTPELFHFTPRRDRATKLLRFIGEVVVNGNPDMKGRAIPKGPLPPPPLPALDLSAPPPAGWRDVLRRHGARGFAEQLRAQKQVQLTDTTMRDAHQSLFATRMRTADLLPIAPYYARLLPGLFSLECWGGATFDVALRFLKEDPWERLRALRAAIPNIPFQMLLRSANAVGYTNYADNVVQAFVQQAAREGIDIFRVFDSLNTVDNMRVAMDAVIEAGGVCEAAICYTGDLFDGSRPKYNLAYYVQRAKALEQAGAHILGIKDMAGVCRPRAAAELVRVLKQEVGLPIHFHTHDTSGIAAASVLAAVEAGCDAVDGALDAMSGLTSQPNLGSMAAALAGHARDPGLDLDAMQRLSDYWEGVRRYYAPFEADIRSGTADVYRHEMPGGQYTNLREQARAMGLESRWPEVAKAYADVNRAFGDIVKVTPSSKVVGDMALFMVAQGLDVARMVDPAVPVDFPESVVQLFRGDLGLPSEPWPAALQAKILRGKPALTQRPGASLAAVDLEAERRRTEAALGVKLSDADLASHLMYPKVFREYVEHQKTHGDVSALPTPVFFYGLAENEEISVDLEPGKTLVIRLQGRTELPDEGATKLFYELNGQPRSLRVPHAGVAQAGVRRKAAEGNPQEVGAPMPGTVARLAVQPGQRVSRGEVLLTLEAMKMETTVAAPQDGIVQGVHVHVEDVVRAGDLLLVLGPA